MAKAKDPFKKYTGLKAHYRVRDGRSLKPIREVDNIVYKSGTIVRLPVEFAENHAKHLVEYVEELDGTTLPVNQDGTTTVREAAKQPAKKKAAKKKATKKKAAKKATKKPGDTTDEDGRASRRQAARKKVAKKKATKKKTTVRRRPTS